MGEIEYFRIKNWEKYQHYKGRHQIWVKLYKDILRSHTWHQCFDSEKAALIALLCIADDGGRVVADQSYVRSATGLRKNPNFVKFLKLGFIEELGQKAQNAASKMLASGRPLEDKRTLDKTIAELASKETVVKSEIPYEKIKALWEKYPRKKAGVIGLHEFDTLIKKHISSAADFNRLEKSVANYVAVCKEHDPKFARNFKRFIEEKYWETYEHQADQKQSFTRSIRQGRPDESKAT